MTYREVTVMEVQDVLCRILAAQGPRDMARQTGIDRKTVRRYAEAAKGAELSAATRLWLLGLMDDVETGHTRKLWVLVVTLAHRRYPFVYPTFDQTLT